MRARPGRWLARGWERFVKDPWALLLVGLITAVLLGVSQFIIWGPVMVGLACVGLRAEKSGRIEPADFFEGFRYFLPAFFSGLLTLILSIIGLILIVPGIVIFSMYLFTFHFIYDQKQGFWQAMESSRKLVARDYLGFSFFGFLIIVINVVGVLFFLVGSVLTSVVTALAITAAYLEATSTETLPESAPPSVPVVID